MRALFDNNTADAAGWLPKVDARAKLALSVVAAVGSLVVSNIQGQILLCIFSMCSYDIVHIFSPPVLLR